MTATAEATPKKVAKKKVAASASSKTAKVVKKKVASGAKKSKSAVHVARTPEQVVAEQTGQTFHGATLSMGNVKKPGKSGILSMLDLKQIQVMPDFNPRSAPGPIDELAASIKSEGILSALVVRPSKTTGKFDLIAGERRWRAAKAADYDQPIPCIIRTDLIGDDERALAVAMAENSEDGRSNLNMIEIGLGCRKLEKKGWPVTRIARESGIHTQRVRRALALVETPADVQKQIQAGNWSVAAGLEYARLDQKTRDAIKDKLGKTTTADDIRAYRKQAEKDALAAKAAKGEAATKTTKAGKPSKKGPITIWKPSLAKQAGLQQLCSILHGADSDQVGTPDYHEIRGAVSALMWDRGDRTEMLPPDLNPEKGSKDYAAQMKDLTGFNAVVKAEAAKYKPDEGDASEASGDEAKG